MKYEIENLQGINSLYVLQAAIRLIFSLRLTTKFIEFISLEDIFEYISKEKEEDVKNTLILGLSEFPFEEDTLKKVLSFATTEVMGQKISLSEVAIDNPALTMQVFADIMYKAIISCQVDNLFFIKKK